MSVGILEIVTIITMFQLLLFSIFLFVRKTKNISNYILGVQLFSQAAGIFTGFCYSQFNYFFENSPSLIFIGFPFSYLWGPTFYLYVKSAAYINFKFRKLDVLHFLPFIVLVIFLLITYFPLTFEEKRSIFINRTYLLISLSNILHIFLRLQVLVYIILSIYTFVLLRKELKERYSLLSTTNLSWIKFLVIGFTVSYFLTIPLIIYGRIIGYHNSLINLLIIAPYFIYFNIIFFKAWYSPQLFSGLEESVKYKSSKLTKEEADEWVKKLDKFVKENKPYFNPELSLNQLAESINVPPRILSQIINEYFNQNFQDYINKLRIEESKRILLDSKNKTVLEILYEVGFNTKSAFNIAFKKFTGLTPTDYRKKHS